jgi:hypothetical protein
VKALIYQNNQPLGVPQRQRRQGPANRIHTPQRHAPGIGPPCLHGAGFPPQETPDASRQQHFLCVTSKSPKRSHPPPKGFWCLPRSPVFGRPHTHSLLLLLGINVISIHPESKSSISYKWKYSYGTKGSRIPTRSALQARRRGTTTLGVKPPR